MQPLSHNRELAAALAQEVQAEPKECFRNSVLAQYRCKGEALYVEGVLLIMGGVLIEHGWLQVDGHIVDTTLHGEPAAHYTPIFTYTKEEVRSHVRRKLRLPYFQHYRDRFEIFMQTQWQMYQEMSEP